MIRRLLFLVCIAVGITWILRTFMFDTISVASGSMEPTLDVGMHFLVNRLVYRFHAPERGDIIVFTSPVDEETGFIKRVIAIPGDSVELRDKKVILNGKPMEEPYTIYKRAKEALAGDNLGPLTVPDGVSLFWEITVTSPLIQRPGRIRRPENRFIFCLIKISKDD